jgi:uncharacterized protein YwqG
MGGLDGAKEKASNSRPVAPNPLASLNIRMYTQGMNIEIESLLDFLRSRIALDPALARLEILPLVRPSIRLATQRVPYARIGLGASRIGGTPDVAPEWEWPRWAPSKQRDDKFGRPWRPSEPTPLGFIAQIDLSTIPQVDEALPRSGWLYFFYDRFSEPWGFDPTDRGCCRVLYTNVDRTSLCRVKAPADADPEHTAQPCLVESRFELTLPGNVPEIPYENPTWDAYSELCDDLTNAGGLIHHRLLGHPQLIQNPMDLECQLASSGVHCGYALVHGDDRVQSLAEGARDWRLLLQIDTDEDGPGWMWGDVGRIYFWIKQQDLAAHRFDDVWLIFQCS